MNYRAVRCYRFYQNKLEKNTKNFPTNLYQSNFVL